MPTPYARATQEAPPVGSFGAKLLRSISLVAVAAAVTFLFLGAALAQQSTLSVGLEPPVQLDPAFASSGAEIAVLNSVYDYLVDVDANNEIQPRLATE
jgi:peptide/nickel transport system substrate-binding protein